MRNTEVIACFPAPVLIASPDQSVFKQGDNVRLTCEFPDSGGKQTYRLFFNDWMIITSSKYNTIKNRNLQPGNSGDYTCDVVTETGTTPRSNVVSIQVVGKLSIHRSIFCQSPRQRYPLSKCSDTNDRPRT